MESLIDKSFDDLNQMTLDIVNKFFEARKIHQLNNENCLKENDFDDENPYDQYLLKVLKAYESLDESERNLINNEFFFQSYHQWWTAIYSKATFYRYKKEAMRKFLGAFYNA